MTKTKAQQIGIITLFIFAALNVFISTMILRIYFNDPLFTELKDVVNSNFLDLLIPILIIISVATGRKLGELILIKREKEIFYHTARTIAVVVCSSIWLTILCQHTYYFINEGIGNGDFQNMDRILSFTGNLLLNHLYVSLGIILFCLFNLIQSTFCGLLHTGTLWFIQKKLF